MPVLRIPICVIGSDHHGRSRPHGACINDYAAGRDSFVAGAAAREVANLHADQHQPGEAGVRTRAELGGEEDAVGGEVADVDQASVGPETTRLSVLVADPELLVTDAHEVVSLQLIREQPRAAPLGDQDHVPIRPEPVRVVVGRIERVDAERFPGRKVVAEETVRAAIQHPHRVAVGPDASGVGVAFVEPDVPLRKRRPGLHVVGEDPVLPAVGDPGRLAVRPEAARGHVAPGEPEVELLEALAALDVVGEDAVVGPDSVPGYPQRLAVGPESRRDAAAGFRRVKTAVLTRGCRNCATQMRDQENQSNYCRAGRKPGIRPRLDRHDGCPSCPASGNATRTPLDRCTG